jgi:hypothetical protein
MKPCSNSFVAFQLAAVLVFSVLHAAGQGTATPAGPPLASPAGVPTDLSPGAGEVIKLAQSGVGDDVVLAYVQNSQAPYNLSANNILYLKSAGLSSDVLKAMLNHDGSLRNVPVLPAQPVPSAQPTAPAPVPTTAQVYQPPTSPMVVIDQQPPPPRGEIVPLAPGPGYAWIPGSWSWRGGTWLWVSGAWVIRPSPGVVWMGGHWARHGHGWIWIGGRWH